MYDIALERRRTDLDRSLHALRALIMVVDPRNVAIVLDRPVPLTSDYARLSVLAARACADTLTASARDLDGRAFELTVCLASVLRSYSDFTEQDANALERVERAALVTA